MLRIRLKFRASNETAKQSFDEIAAHMGAKFHETKVYPQAVSDGKFRYLVVIPVGESSISLGYGLNVGGKCDCTQGFCEFNPTKVYPSDELRFLYRVLGRAGNLDRRVIRWDFATDYPVPRSNLALMRDKRSYRSVISKAFTEYLGTRNKNGFVKVYDKQKEQEANGKEQSGPLTRVEVTIEERPGKDVLTGANGEYVIGGEWPRIVGVPEEIPGQVRGNLRLVLLAWTHGVELEVCLQGCGHNQRTKYRNAIAEMCGVLRPPEEYDRCRREALAWANEYGGGSSV